jgi:branched-chain amino acid transport system substrate-binding protein
MGVELPGRRAQMKGTLGFLILGAMLARPALAAEPVRAGLMAPLTGAWASEGQEMKRAVELVAAEANARGGILGRKIEVLVEDDGGDPRTGSLAAQRLASRNVAVVVGTYGSSITEAAQGILDEAEIIQIANGSTAVRLSSKGLPLFFRTCARDDDQGRFAVGVLAKSGAKKVAIVHDNTSYAKGLADAARAGLSGAGLSGAGLSLVFFDAITPGERDTTTILTKLKAAKPDVVFFTGYYPEGGLLLRQKREMGWPVPFVGGDATTNPDLVKIAGKAAAEGFLSLSPPLPQDLDTPDAKAFLAAYKTKYGAPPRSIYGVLAADALSAWLRAVEAVKSTDSRKVAGYLHGGMKDFVGLTGKIAFDARGDRVGDVYRVYRADANGTFVLTR